VERPRLPELWNAPAPAAAPEQLRIEPLHAVAGLGESVVLHVLGTHAPRVRCVTDAGETEAPPRLEIASPQAAGVVDVLCGIDGVRAAAQITFTAAQTLPVADPYAGGVALFKLRRLAAPLDPLAGTRALGHATLDAKLEKLSAWALRAFPFADPSAHDQVGIGRWIAIDVPRGTNYYQAIDWIRSDPAVEPASYLPVDSDWLRVARRGDWPEAFAPVADASSRRPRSQRQPAPAPAPAPGFAPRDLRLIGAPEVWSSRTGEGVRIAIVDTGLDSNHAALAPNLISKPGERPGVDSDGNGIPGDAIGANFAHLALLRGDGPPSLALGLVSDVSDWHGALDGGENWGHGTAIASLAAGAGGPGARLGVAPRAQLIAVDVEENLRASASTLHHEDPRQREREAGGPPLRSGVWSRAAGVVYAVSARARVLTCAWSADTPHLLLHDALAYAEDNCALPVCAVEAPPGPLDSYPAQWRAAWLAHNDLGNGSVLDLWSGELHEDLLERPLSATLIAGALEARGKPTAEAEEIEPDLFAPTGGWRGRGGVAAAASNPRNDQTPLPDYRAAPFRGPAAAAGLIAGTAALVSELRPDLDPSAVAASLREGTREFSGYPLLHAPGALRSALQRQPGTCADPDPQRKRITADLPARRPRPDPDPAGSPASPAAAP
jgi:subtilisin family serine protease